MGGTCHQRFGRGLVGVWHCATNFVHHWSQGFQVRMSEMTRGVGFAPEYGPGPSLSIPALLERIYLQIEKIEIGQRDRERNV